MLSNELDTQAIINEILTNKFSIDLVKIEITSEGEILQGKGTIYQDDEGQLLLKFFSDRFFSKNEWLNSIVENHNKDNPEGNIISEFDKIEGYDINEQKYTCNRILRRGSMKNVMKFELLGTLDAAFDFGNNTRAIFAGKYKIPDMGHAFIETNVDQLYIFTDFKDIWKIKVNEDLNILVTKYEDYLDTLVLGDQIIGFQYVWHIIDSLNFVLGIELEPVFINVQNEGHRIYNRQNLLKSKSSFSAPLISNHNCGDEFTASNHNSLFCAYYNFIRNDSKKKLPIIHKRIVSGSRSYIFAEALILSVQIETICKEYFSSYYCPDTSYIKAIENGIEIISESNMEGKRILVGKLKGMISRKGTRDISVTNILKNMSKQQLITKSLIERWDSLRSITAHGDNYKDDEYHALLSNMFLCTNLYYQLIFSLVGYKGNYSWKEYKKNHIETYPFV